MKCGLGDLRRKEVIDIATGERLGYIDDAVIDLDASKIESLTIFGRQRLFGIFGRNEDLYIPCSDIRVIGTDVILVRISGQYELSQLINNDDIAQKKSV